MPKVATLDPTHKRLVETDVQWAARGGAKLSTHNAADYLKNLDPTRENIGSLNDPQGHLTPEQELWQAVIRQAIDDASGTSGAAGRCFECHDIECGCSSAGRPGPRPPAFTACSKAKHHTYRTCAKRWLASKDFETACELIGLEPTAVRRLV